MIQLSNITLRHGAEPLLEQASAIIYPGHKVGLIGANGSGKTSLFNLLLGRLAVDAGEISVPDDWTIAHMAQEITELDRPAIEYVIDGDEQVRAAERAVTEAESAGDGVAIGTAHTLLSDVGGHTAEARAGSLLAGLGFAADTHRRPVGDFSGGWRIRLSLARALMTPSDLLLLDEPTNHLDLETVIWLEEWLRRYQGTLLLISHDRDFIDQVVGSVIHIEHRKLNAYSGGYTNFERQRAERLANQQATFEKQQRQIEHMQKFVDRFRAKASKAKAAQSRIKAIERMEKVAPAHADSPFDFVFEEPPRAGNPLLQFEQVRLGYGNLTVLDGVSLSLVPGDRIGLLGLNGAGKSTLVRALAGELEPLFGEVTTSRGLNIGYFAQHQIEQLDDQASPLLHLERLAPDSPEQPLRNFLGSFDFRNEMATDPAGRLSGGEKARLVLALLVWQRPNLLLLDEPTNHLDLEMRYALTVALQGFEGAVITVSHDRHLLRETVENFWLVDAGAVTRFNGDLDDYRRWLADRSAAQRQETAAGRPNGSKPARQDKRTQRRNAAERRATIKPLQNRVDRLNRELEQASSALKGIEQALADPALYESEDRSRLDQLLRRQAELRDTVGGLETEWMQAAESLDRALQK